MKRNGALHKTSPTMQRILTGLELATIFAAITSPRFVTLRGYESTTSGEVAHHRVNVGVSSASAKKADVLDYEAALANGTFADRPELLAACQRLYERALANLSNETRSNQSAAASESRVHVGQGRAVFYNETSGELFVEGYSLGKEVVVPGTYKVVKSKPETLAQNAVKKELKIRMDSWRTWKLSGITSARVNGEELEIELAPTGEKILA
jgi:hypothetical protein